MLAPEELALLHRTLHGTREHRRRAEEKAGGSENKMKDILNKLGLAYTAGPLADLMFDYYRQMPYEPMHAEKIGLMKKFLSCFLASLTGIALLELNARMKKFPIIQPWSRSIVPVELTSSDNKLDDRHVKTNATDTGRVCCVLGLILRGWIKENHFRPQSATLLKCRVGDE